MNLSIHIDSSLPIGVLFDIHHVAAKDAVYDGLLPWKVTITFPTVASASSFSMFEFKFVSFLLIILSLLIYRSSLKQCESSFFHSIKQAVTLLSGSTKRFNDLSIEKQQRIWAAANKGSLEDWKQSCCETLQPPFLCEMKNLPVRVLLIHPSTSSGPGSSTSSSPGVSLFQRPIPSLVNSTAAGFSPHHDPFLRCGRCNRCQLIPTSHKGPGPAEDWYEEPLLRALLTQLTLSQPLESYRCSVQGLPVSLDSPLAQLWRLLAHGDLFLYILIFPEPAPS